MSPRICKCGHPWETHGDRAVAACVPETATKKCWCQGWEIAEPTFGFCQACQATMGGVTVEPVKSFRCAACGLINRISYGE